MITAKPHVNPTPWMKLLVYGQPGVGKTTLAGSAVEHDDMRDVWFLSVEGGMLSVPNNPNVFVTEIRNTPEVSAYQQFEEALWAIAGRDETKYPWIPTINTVVIDSGSELLTLVLESLVAAGVAADKTHSRDPNAVYLQDYGVATTSLKRLYRYFRDAPCHLIITALSKNVYPVRAGKKDETAQPIGVVPNFTDKLGESIMGYVDHTWLLYVDDKGRHLLTQSNGIFRAKTRGQAFAKKIGLIVNEPYLPKLYDTLIACEGAKDNA